MSDSGANSAQKRAVHEKQRWPNCKWGLGRLRTKAAWTATGSTRKGMWKRGYLGSRRNVADCVKGGD